MSRPGVVVAEDAYRVLMIEARASRDGDETGGICLGKPAQASEAIFEVTVAGTPGPGAKRSPSEFHRDLDHAQRLETNAFRRDGSVWIGEWHTHPRGPGRPSATDRETYGSLLSDADLRFDVFLSLIVTPHWYFGWQQPVCHAWIVTQRRMNRAHLRIRRSRRVRILQ